MLRGFGIYNLIGLICGVILFGVVSMSNADDQSSMTQPPTVAEAEAFIKNAEAKLLELSVNAARADWVKATYITDDTEILAAQADERAIAAQVEFAKQATRFDGLNCPPSWLGSSGFSKLRWYSRPQAMPTRVRSLPRLPPAWRALTARGSGARPAKINAWISKTWRA